MILKEHKDLYEWLRNFKDEKYNNNTLKKTANLFDKEFILLINKMPKEKQSILRIGILDENNEILDIIKNFKGNGTFDDFVLKSNTLCEASLMLSLIDWFNPYDLFCYYNKNYELQVFKFEYIIYNNELKIYKKDLFKNK